MKQLGVSCCFNKPNNRNASAVIQRLLVKKADINAANNYGHTPLMIAASMGHYRICKGIFLSSALTAGD